MMKRVALITIPLVALLTLAILRPMTIRVVGCLLLGWIAFVMNVSDRMQVDWSATAAATVCLVLATVGLHAVLSWIARHRRGQESSSGAWCWGWSAAMTGLFVLVFLAGIAVIGITHQVAWLLAGREPLVEARPITAYRDNSDTNLKMTGSAIQTFHDINGSLPQGGTSNAEGVLLHSWMTQILPYLWMTFDEQIDFSLPWDHPKHAAEFRRFVPHYLNPEVSALRSDEGFALSHYAGNVHVLGGGKPLRFEDISDGTANTILAGEVAAEFKPWGYPMNWRDPADGVNRLAGGFADPGGGRVHFLMADGSVRSFGKETSPSVLKAMATPRGKERLPAGIVAGREESRLSR